MDNIIDKFDEIVYFNSEENQSEKDKQEEENYEEDEIKLEPILNLNITSMYKKDDFIIEQLIGKGSYSKIVKAKNTKLNITQAIKIIDLNFICKENKLYQIHVEKIINESIDHPNIIKYDSMFIDNDKLFIVMEYAENGDLSDFINNNFPLNLETVKYFMAQIVNILEYFRGIGLIHRDLKAENIVIDKNYNLKIIDFATAKFVGKTFDWNSLTFREALVTDINTFVGTANYIAPEYLNNGQIGFGADLWALGVLLYELLHGYAPFNDRTEYLIFKRITELRYVIENEIPDDVADLLKKLLVLDPLQRLGAGEIGLTNNSLESLKSHKFFTLIDFNNINNEVVPYCDEFIIKPKDIKCKPKTSNKCVRHGTVKLLKIGILEKKSPWFHYNTRRIILDSNPKLEYKDPEKNTVKGVIYLTKECHANYIEANYFELITPKRIFKFRTQEGECISWINSINDAIDKYSN